MLQVLHSEQTQVGILYINDPPHIGRAHHRNNDRVIRTLEHLPTCHCAAAKAHGSTQKHVGTMLVGMAYVEALL